MRFDEPTCETDEVPTMPWCGERITGIKHFIHSVNTKIEQELGCELGQQFHLTVVCMHTGELISHIDEPGSLPNFDKMGGDGPGDVIIVIHLDGPDGKVTFCEWGEQSRPREWRKHIKTKVGSYYAFQGTVLLIYHCLTRTCFL